MQGRPLHLDRKPENLEALSTPLRCSLSTTRMATHAAQGLFLGGSHFRVSYSQGDGTWKEEEDHHSWNVAMATIGDRSQKEKEQQPAWSESLGFRDDGHPCPKPCVRRPEPLQPKGREVIGLGYVSGHLVLQIGGFSNTGSMRPRQKNINLHTGLCEAGKWSLVLGSTPIGGNDALPP